MWKPNYLLTVHTQALKSRLQLEFREEIWRNPQYHLSLEDDEKGRKKIEEKNIHDSNNVCWLCCASLAKDACQVCLFLLKLYLDSDIHPICVFMLNVH